MTRILFAVAFLALLSACGQINSMPTTTFNDAAAQRAHAMQTVLLYVGGPNANDVDVYPAFRNNPQPRRHIVSGLHEPTGMAVDGDGNLYVCNNARQRVSRKSGFWTVTVYRRGSSTPFLTYTDGIVRPTDVAIAQNGRTYVANLTRGVTEYPAGSVHPSRVLPEPPHSGPIGVAVDAAGNVFVSYVGPSTQGGSIYEYPNGASSGTNLDVAFEGSPHGVAVDRHENLILAVSDAPGSGSEVRIFARNSRHPKKILRGPLQPFMVTLSHDERRLYVADYGDGNDDGGVFVYAYPSGKLLYKDTQGAAAGAYGVAIDE